MIMDMSLDLEPKNFEMELEKGYDQFEDFIYGLSDERFETFEKLNNDELQAFLELDDDMKIKVLDKFEKLDNEIPITELDEMQLEKSETLKLNEKQTEIDYTNIDELELKKALEIKNVAEDLRMIYKDYYDRVLKNEIKDFILETEIPKILHFESRLKSDASVYRSVTNKPEYDGPSDLNDYVGLRFVVENERDAYSLAKLLWQREINEKEKFNLYNSKDYFITPKLGKDGNIQYRGLHITLENDGYRVEVQIHTRDTYRKTELTHQKYEKRERIVRTGTQSINFEKIK